MISIDMPPADMTVRVFPASVKTDRLISFTSIKKKLRAWRCIADLFGDYAQDLRLKRLFESGALESFPTRLQAMDYERVWAEMWSDEQFSPGWGASSATRDASHQRNQSDLTDTH